MNFLPNTKNPKICFSHARIHVVATVSAFIFRLWTYSKDSILPALKAAKFDFPSGLKISNRSLGAIPGHLLCNRYSQDILLLNNNQMILSRSPGAIPGQLLLTSGSFVFTPRSCFKTSNIDTIYSFPPLPPVSSDREMFKVKTVKNLNDLQGVDCCLGCHHSLPLHHPHHLQLPHIQVPTFLNPILLKFKKKSILNSHSSSSWV